MEEPPPLPDVPHPREVLERAGIRASRSLGQNFLVPTQIMDRMVECAAPGVRQVVLEIGMGLGRLTARLARRAAHVVSVEIHEQLHRIALQNLGGSHNVTLLRCDFLDSKHAINPQVTEAALAAGADSNRPLMVVSNLPYGISSPAIVNLLEWQVAVRDMWLMLQREVAERVLAAPGTSEYGPLTVFVDYWGRAARQFDVPRRAFWPAPKVDSTVVRIQVHRGPCSAELYHVFAALVTRLFMHRRKTLRRTLTDAYDGETARSVLKALDVEGNARVETLTAEQLLLAARTVARPPHG